VCECSNLCIFDNFKTQVTDNPFSSHAPRTMTAMVLTSLDRVGSTHHHKMAIMDAMPVDSEESDTECAMTNDDAFWSKIDLDSLHMLPNGSKLACSQPIADKRAKHKLVERRRRDKTRAFVEQLQAVLPNIEQRRQNPNVNVILEKTLDYLHTIKIDPCGSSKHGDRIEEEENHSNMDVVQIFLAKVVNSMPVDDITTRKYIFSFESAPFGIVISRIDGVFLKANEFFRNLFNFPQAAPLMLTMFSLTASQDLATTMKVQPPPCAFAALHSPPPPSSLDRPSPSTAPVPVGPPALTPRRHGTQAASTLLNGSAARLSFTKECVRPDGGSTGPLFVDMMCVWKDNRWPPASG
jgi:hypothetical protein